MQGEAQLGVRGAAPAGQVELSPGLALLLSVASGTVAAGSYFVQPMVGPISADLAMPAWVGGILVAITQLGYCAGLILIGPLGDVVENRRLILALLTGSILSLAGAALAPSGAMLMGACLGIGICSTAVQLDRKSVV